MNPEQLSHTQSSKSRQREFETIRSASPLPYDQALADQIKRRTDVEKGVATNALFLLEHTPVFTLGRDTNPANLLLSESDLAKEGIEVCQADRGGDVTYHGPGQLVAYPILDLNQWRQSISWYLRALEQVLINQLKDYGLEGYRAEGFTGVWVNGAKVAAIGIAIHNWVTYHGVALNINPDMTHFTYIVPCGIPDKPVACLHQLMNSPPTMNQAMDDFERHFRTHFSKNLST